MRKICSALPVVLFLGLPADAQESAPIVPPLHLSECIESTRYMGCLNYGETAEVRGLTATINSIIATTDLTTFLRAGIPLELNRAALRRAWVSDPVIRDFIEQAENAWDFNDPNAVPGFGPLDQTPEQIREMVKRISGQPRHSRGSPHRGFTGESDQ